MDNPLSSLIYAFMTAILFVGVYHSTKGIKRYSILAFLKIRDFLLEKKIEREFIKKQVDEAKEVLKNANQKYYDSNAKKSLNGSLNSFDESDPFDGLRPHNDNKTH